MNDFLPGSFGKTHDDQEGCVVDLLCLYYGNYMDSSSNGWMEQVNKKD